ncbi:MAG: AAA family ATPase [Erythrobacter sp.]
MRLHSVTVQNFRRFATKETIHTSSKLTALTGANEAGKSSFLRALELLNDDSPIPERELNLDGPIDPVESSSAVISAIFEISKPQLEEHGLPSGSAITVSKPRTGKREYNVSPSISIERNRNPRQEFYKQLSTLSDDDALVGQLGNVDAQARVKINNALALLNGEEETLSNLEPLEMLSQFLSDAKDVLADVYDVSELPKLAARLLEHEKGETPAKIIEARLIEAVPTFLMFDKGDRELSTVNRVGLNNAQNQPDLSQVIHNADHLPKSLRNLANICGLDLTKYAEAIRKNLHDTIVPTLEIPANEKLRELFDGDWNQSNVRPQFASQPGLIRLRAFTSGKASTGIQDRSDGLKQFIALYAFVKAKRESNPILLIDEAERGLHYDAQADFIKYLTEQDIAPQIIFTTHSAGCLPPNLASGVKILETHEETEGRVFPRSSIKDRYWIDSDGRCVEQIGVEPLLLGMGAQALAFFPVQNAAIVEGESDQLLLPTMLAEALGNQKLTFQTIPGISRTSGQQLPLLAAQGKVVVFVVDSDGGGEDLENQIVAAGFDKKQIVPIGADNNLHFTIEDFVDPKLLADGVNRTNILLALGAPEFDAKQFRANDRLSQLSDHFERDKQDLPKVQFASCCLEIFYAETGRKILDPGNREIFESFAATVYDHLKPNS